MLSAPASISITILWVNSCVPKAISFKLLEPPLNVTERLVFLTSLSPMYHPVIGLSYITVEPLLFCGNS